ncbi:chemotaxis protein CheD [Hydrogenophaga sp. 5NK40-0174]|uniref:chemotaxis protein CheD n=1 Tax=Hydrogenophaga sp. 5NK40-0174 TaxID=3127649 RepID=UPI0031066C44
MNALVSSYRRRTDQAILQQESLGRVYVVHPGQVATAMAGERLETLLGSCVSVILTDPRRTIGAMCHIVHVGVRGGSGHLNAAHGSVALQTMEDMLMSVGVNPGMCHAYVYGGGNQFPTLYRRTHVGANNVAWVMHALQRKHIHIVHADVGGEVYRRVRWMVGHGAPDVSATPIQGEE